MIRFAFSVAFFLTIFGCNPNRDVPVIRIDQKNAQHDDSKPGAIEHEWTTILSNEWYDLSELRVNEKQSIFHWKITKTDAQLGIGVAIDVGVLAKPRGFTHFRVIKSNPHETHAEFLKDIEFNEEQINELIVVDFYMAEPDQSEPVFNVDMMVTLARQRELGQID